MLTTHIASWFWPSIVTFIVCAYLLWDGIRPSTNFDAPSQLAEGFLYALTIVCGAIIILLAWFVWALFG